MQFVRQNNTELQTNHFHTWHAEARNSLPDNLRDSSHCSSSFGRDLKTALSRDTSVFSAIEMLHDIALYKLTIDTDIDTDIARGRDQNFGLKANLTSRPCYLSTANVMKTLKG